MHPTLVDIQAAAERIRLYTHHTPVVTCASLDQEAEAKAFRTYENLQKAGTFKFRGACNAIFSLSNAEAARGVVAHLRGIPAYLVLPSDAPTVKKAGVPGQGTARQEPQARNAGLPWKR